MDEVKKRCPIVIYDPFVDDTEHAIEIIDMRLKFNIFTDQFLKGIVHIKVHFNI